MIPRSLWNIFQPFSLCSEFLGMGNSLPHKLLFGSSHKKKAQAIRFQDRKVVVSGVPVWLHRLRIQPCHCCGSGLIPGPETSTGHRLKNLSLVLALLWLWHRPAATAPIRPLDWEPPYAMGTALKRQKNKLIKRKTKFSSHILICARIMN